MKWETPRYFYKGPIPYEKDNCSIKNNVELNIGG
jgi:hypothetical protein